MAANSGGDRWTMSWNIIWRRILRFMQLYFNHLRYRLCKKERIAILFQFLQASCIKIRILPSRNYFNPLCVKRSFEDTRMTQFYTVLSKDFVSLIRTNVIIIFVKIVEYVDYLWIQLINIHSVAKVYAVLPFYDVKCLCSGGREWGREESHPH